MAEYNEGSSSPDPPPPYSTVNNQSSPATVETPAPAVTAQQVTHSDRQREHSNRHTRQPEGRQHHDGGAHNAINHTVGTVNASNSFNGFIDIMYEKKKLPRDCVRNIIYKLGMFLYFLVNLVYSITAAVVQGDHLIYHLVYASISFVGFAFELIKMLLTIKMCLTPRRGDEDDTTQTLLQPPETQRADVQVQDYYRKGGTVLVDYVLSSIGEFLIYPTLICVMYGFINERAWQFDSKISICTFIVFVYNVIMDTLYMKFYVTWLVIRVLRASYVKYDELAKPTETEWQRYFTPVYLSILFAITTALTHWLMTGIVAVRIYIDIWNTLKVKNINSSILDTGDYKISPFNSSILDTGDYKISPFTGCMIACTVYLPIVSWITYIIINKLWFYKVYSAISQLGTGRADHMPVGDTWNKKLLAFIKDPLAYIATMFLMVPFIGFMVAAYLPDYDSVHYEVASSARDAIHTLRPWFMVLFLLSNIQAAISFIIVPCRLPVVVYYKCHNKKT